MNRLTIVTLGTGGDAFLTRGVERALHEAPRVVLRTARHPMADFLKEEGIAFETLDALYDECEDFDTFNRAAAVKVLSLLNESPVCYAVSDAAFDETVAQIQRLKPREADVRVLPGVSHADRCLALVADAPAGVRLYAAESFLQTRVSPEEPLLVTELHSRECAGSIKLRLMDLLPEDLPVSFFTGDETTGELAMHSVPLYELDRQSAYDHLTAAYVPAVPMERRTRYDMDDLVHVMERLRAPTAVPGTVSRPMRACCRACWRRATNTFRPCATATSTICTMNWATCFCRSYSTPRWRASMAISTFTTSPPPSATR